MPSTADFEIPLGDDTQLLFALKNGDGTPFDLTDPAAAVECVVGPLAKKTRANGAVVVADAAQGFVNLAINAADRSAGAGLHPFSIVGITAAGKRSTTIIGTISFKAHPTSS